MEHEADLQRLEKGVRGTRSDKKKKRHVKRERKKGLRRYPVDIKKKIFKQAKQIPTNGFNRS